MKIKLALMLFGIALLFAACTTVQQELPEGCDPSFAGAEACTMQYDPVCATYEDGTEQTIGNECVACTSDEDIISIRPGECETRNNTMPDPDNESVTGPLPGENDNVEPRNVEFTECSEPRPEVCTREYRPVCAALEVGYDTRGNSCDACSDEDVSGYFEGACEEQLFVVCGETVTGFSPEEYAEQQGGICVDECPEEFDPYTTQIGIQLCIEHYGVEKIEDWPVCERSSETCNCVRTTETTTSEQIDDAQYRCVPDQYAERLLFTSGQDRLDENGESSVAIA